MTFRDVPVGFFASSRVALLRDLEVFHGLLLPEIRANDPLLAEHLRRWPGKAYLQERGGGAWLTLVRRAAPRPRERWWLHALLFAATLLTATMAGAILAGSWLPEHRAVGGVGIPLPALPPPSRLAPGLWFSLPLIAVLLGHELGHYFAARWHAMDVSPPWFAPAPYLVSLIGTFGAFIRLRSPLVNRAVLLDVGAAGPAVSFVLSLPVLLAGFALSRPLPGTHPEAHSALGIVIAGQFQLSLGESALVHLLRMASGLGDAPLVALHPLAVAGWFGLFFTMLNLFPIAQLDGGHVAYALFGPRGHRVVGLLFLAFLLAMGLAWEGWWMWAALVLLIGRGRVGHPAVADPAFRLTGWRRAAAWASLAAFLSTFVPVPA